MSDIPTITKTDEWLVSMPIDVAREFGVKAPTMELHFTPSGKCVVPSYNGRKPDVYIRSALDGKPRPFVVFPNEARAQEIYERMLKRRSRMGL